MPSTDHEKRREAIRELLSSGESQNSSMTQGALAAALEASGFSATQSSVSRDLRELGAIKTSDGYQLPDIDSGATQQLQAIASLVRDQIC